MIYDPPKGIDPPDLWKIKDYNAETKKYEKKLRDFCYKKAGDNHTDYTGKIVSFPVADGAARYMVINLDPLEMIHLKDGDAYDFQWIEFIPGTEIKSMINARKQFEKSVEPRKT